MIQTFLAGVVVGIIFGVLRLPVPAPNTLAGVLGILGLFIGWWIVSR